MKRFLLLFGLFVFLLAARPAFADSSVCNKSCQVNEDCGKGYRCYVGICRAVVCPSSPTCGCDVSVSPTPVPKTTTLVEATPTPVPKATPIPAKEKMIKRAPSTGFSTPPLLIAIFSLFVGGVLLKAYAEE